MIGRNNYNPKFFINSLLIPELFTLATTEDQRRGQFIKTDGT